ncbi:MAG: PAS domain S-box protein [Bacteroidales bacterium]|nr:PAS domain S-box protein [Bacteroidales bacterium]
MIAEKRFSPDESKKFRLVLEYAPVAVFIMDKNWNFEYINPEFEKLSGFNRQELLHKNISETIYKNIQRIPESRSEVFSSLIKGNSWKGELLTINHAGSKYWAETTASPYKNEKGEIEGYIVIQRDVTESKQMQEELQRSEQRFRELTEMLPQTIYELDTLGNITYMNQTGLDNFGITSIDQGNSAFSFIVPEEHEKMRLNMEKSFDEDFHSPGNNYTVVRKNGEKFPVMIFASHMKTDGVVTGTRGIIIDMTEHEAMENALRESEEKYKILIEKATDGIVITQNGILKFTNQAMCDMMQYRAEEFLDKSFYDYVIPEDHAIMQQFHKRRMKGEKFNSLYRSHFIRKDGTVITVELNTRTYDYNGSPAAFIVIRNISDRLNIEKELMQAKNDLESLNKNLEERIKESSDNLTEARTQLIRLQKENLQSQFEVLRQQVNPHFLFNSLNVLTSLIKLEPDLAEKFTEHLSKVYRYVLENKDNDLVDLKTELDFLNAYLFLLNIRFKGKILVTINIEKDKTDFLILPLALQLLIENAIKHNSMSKKAPLRINLFIDRKNFLNVENNLQERESYITSTGVGLVNIEHRYQLLEMEAPEFVKTETSFIARIPLKQPEIQQQNS